MPMSWQAGNLDWFGWTTWMHRLPSNKRTPMLILLQKYAPAISISLLIILLVTLIFQQGLAQTLSTIILVFGLGTAILFTIHGNWETKQKDELTNSQFARNTTIDLLGLALIMLSAMWLGRMAGGYAGETWGMIAGIVAGIVAGFGAALVVGKLWSRVSERLRVSAK